MTQTILPRFSRVLIGRNGIRLLLSLATSILLLAAAACTPAAESDQPADVIVVPTQGAVDATILERLTEDSDYALFLNAWSTAGLTNNLQQGGPFTVFAPVNTAFGRIQTTSATMDPTSLQSMLQHHIVAGQLSPDDLAAAGSLTTAAGGSLEVSGAGDNLMLGYSTIIGEPVRASNGLIYPIDAVMVPPETGGDVSLWGRMQSDERFSQMVELMGGTDTMYLLRFSDEPDAFLAVPNERLSATLPDLSGLSRTDDDYDAVFAYHLLLPDGWSTSQNFSVADMLERGEVQTGVFWERQLSRDNFAVEVTEEGDTVFVNGVPLLETDIPASNGMLHVIDGLLPLPELEQ